MDFITEDDLDNLLEAEIVTIYLDICRCKKCKSPRIIDINHNERYIKNKEKIEGKNFFRCYYCEFVNVLNTKKDVNKYPKASISYNGKIKHIYYDHNSCENDYYFIAKLFRYDIESE